MQLTLDEATSHVAARAGAQVQVLHRGSRQLQKFDPDLLARLVESTKGLGVEVSLNTEVVAVERQADQLVVHARTDAQKQTFEADMVVHAAGRALEIDNLDLEVAGVAQRAGGVAVNVLFGFRLRSGLARRGQAPAGTDHPCRSRPPAGRPQPVARCRSKPLPIRSLMTQALAVHSG